MAVRVTRYRPVGWNASHSPGGLESAGKKRKEKQPSFGSRPRQQSSLCAVALCYVPFFHSSSLFQSLRFPPGPWGTSYYSVELLTSPPASQLFSRGVGERWSRRRVHYARVIMDFKHVRSFPVCAAVLFEGLIPHSSEWQRMRRDLTST